MATTVLAENSSITYSPQSAWMSILASGGMATTRANATAELSFIGEFVEVYGTILSVEHGRSVSTYSVDNSTPVVFNSTNVSNKEFIPLFAFYQSPPGLENGSHSLVITSTENQTPFILDYIVYGSNNLSSSATPLFAGTPILNPPSSSLPSSSTASSDISSSSHKVPVGGIVGGIIAVLVLLAGLVAWLLIRRRMNRRTEKHRTVTPFITSRNESRDSNRMLISPVPQYIDEKSSPPPFVPSPAAVAAQRGSMYKPGSSDVLPPMEFGYGGGV